MKRTIRFLVPHILAAIVSGAPFPQGQGGHASLITKNIHPVQPKSLLPDETSSDGFLFFSSPGAILSSSIKTTTVIPSVSVLTTSSLSGTVQVTVQVLPPLSTGSFDTTGTVISSLETFGHATSPPIITSSIPSPVTRMAPTEPTPVNFKINTVAADANIFQPIDTSPPPSNLGSRSDHPVPRLGIKPQSAPLDTNKFYANFFLGT